MSNKSNQQKPIRISDNLSDDLFELKGRTIEKFKREVSMRELTEAIPNHPKWKLFKKDFMDTVVDFKNNKKGSGWDYIILSITTLFMLVFFIVFSFGVHTAYTTIQNMTNPTITLLNGSQGVLNITGAFSQTLGQVDTSYLSLRWLGIIMVFASFLSIVVSNYFVKDYPIAFLPYTIFILLSVFISTYISNAYESFINSSFISAYASEWVGYNWLMANLPSIIVVVGFIGAIVMFSNILQPNQQ